MVTVEAYPYPPCTEYCGDAPLYPPRLQPDPFILMGPYWYPGVQAPALEPDPYEYPQPPLGQLRYPAKESGREEDTRISNHSRRQNRDRQSQYLSIRSPVLVCTCILGMHVQIQTQVLPLPGERTRFYHPVFRTGCLIVTQNSRYKKRKRQQI